MTTYYMTVQAANRKFEICRFATLVTVQWWLNQLDPQDPEVFRLAVSCCLQVGVKPKDLAKQLRTTQATISRWSRKGSLPRTPLERQTFVDEMRARINSTVEMEITERPGFKRVMTQTQAALLKKHAA